MSVIINGTSGISTDGGSELFGSGSIGGSLTLTSGTANGVTYLNGSKVLTSGSGLTFDGTNLTFTGFINNSTSATGNPSAFGSTSNGDKFIAINSGAWKAAIGVNGAANMWQQSTDAFLWYLNTNEQMRLTSTGLGIGTSSPAQKLDVYGNGMKVNNASYTGYIGADSVFGSSGVASSFTVRSDNALTFSTGGPYTRATLDNSGNLGLGVTPSSSTTAQFQIGRGVVNAVSNYTTLGDNATFDGSWKYIASTGASLYQQNTGAHAWYTAPSGTAGNAISFTQAMTLTSGGSLEIGGTSVLGAEKLGISRSSYGEMMRWTDGVVGGYIGTTSSALTEIVSGNGLIFNVDLTERMRITSDGNVGIGTDSPSEELTIVKDVNSAARLRIENPNANDSASCGVILVPETGTLVITANSSTHTGSAITGSALGAGIYASSTLTNGLSLGATAGPVRLFSGSNSAARVTVDTAGRVTMPYQPMATFYNPAQVTVTEGSVISWANSTHEQGGLTANTSTNRMTVPVAGKYLVSVNLSVSSTAANAIGDGIFINIVKNGTIYLASSAHVMHNFSDVAGVELPFNNTMIVSCAANDYITFSFTNLSSSGTIQYGSASIYLIG